MKLAFSEVDSMRCFKNLGTFALEPRKGSALDLLGKKRL